MTLEDHLGDILRKARAMTGVSLEAAAAAAGLTAANLAQLEESGQSSRPPNWPALAALLSLDPAKLAGLASGWLPALPDLARWRELRVLTTGGDGLTVNSYLIWDEVTREAALFDTGFDPAPIVQLIEDNQLQLRHLFVTHGHPDHVACLPALRERFPKAHLHCDARDALPQHKNRRNDCTHLGSLRISNRPTPGHAEDGVTYLVGNWDEDAPFVAIVGDALFAGSMGRGNQSWELARQAVREQIFTLPPETLICPGHGPLTTVAEERAHNPFF